MNGPAGTSSPLQAPDLRCRFCHSPLREPLVDLGLVPLANSYLEEADLDREEPRFPLKPWICESCWLVQLPEWESPAAIFTDYAYFSSYAESWLDHARRYCAEAVERFHLGPRSLVIEVASNDGYLLQYLRRDGIRVLGIEPAANVAEVAEERGIPTVREFFGVELARRLVAEGRRADLLVANNVFAHVPDVNDFTAGVALLLAADGVATFEFPHLLRLIEETLFDTIYHEHYSYYSVETARAIFAAHGLELFHVEELETHGGSVRVFVRHRRERPEPSPQLHEILARERSHGLRDLPTYRLFADRVAGLRRELREFLVSARERGETVLGYGAPAKGNTLLCYCEVTPELLPFTVDRSPHKQGRYLPGSRIPIRHPDELLAASPDWVLVLPWNLRDEIVAQMAAVRERGGRFLVAVPTLREVA